MAGVSGVHGNVTWAGKTSLPTEVHSWTADIEHEAVEVTPFSPTNNARVFIPLDSHGWSGSFEVYLDHTQQPLVAEINTYATQLRLQTEVGREFVGCAICEVVSVTGPVDGVMTVTVNFRGTMEMTVTWPPTTTPGPTTTPEPTTTV